VGSAGGTFTYLILLGCYEGVCLDVVDDVGGGGGQG